MSATGIAKELNIIAKNIRVFIKKNKLTREVLKNMGLEPEDISDDTRSMVEDAAAALTNESIPEKERIARAEKILTTIQKDDATPAKIRDMIISTALERLETAKAALDNPRISIVAGVMRLEPTLDLLIYEDEKTLKQLRRFGVTEVPEFVRDAAKKAKAILDDESVPEGERRRRAADVLAELLQPGYFRGEDIPEIPHKLKVVLWEIAYGLSRLS
jgi:uncharacterized protein (UPF0147 family)